MSRADGLVQRRNVSHSSSADGQSAHGRGSDDEERCKDEEDIDSKATRFTLMEEILLLGLKDEQVTIANTETKKFNNPRYRKNVALWCGCSIAVAK